MSKRRKSKYRYYITDLDKTTFSTLTRGHVPDFGKKMIWTDLRLRYRTLADALVNFHYLTGRLGSILREARIVTVDGVEICRGVWNGQNHGYEHPFKVYFNRELPLETKKEIIATIKEKHIGWRA